MDGLRHIQLNQAIDLWTEGFRLHIASFDLSGQMCRRGRKNIATVKCIALCGQHVLLIFNGAMRHRSAAAAHIALDQGEHAVIGRDEPGVPHAAENRLAARSDAWVDHDSMDWYRQEKYRLACQIARAPQTRRRP